MKRNTLTQERLKQLVHYDKDTGIFTWALKDCRKKVVGNVAGQYNDQGYILISIDEITYRSHRLAWLYIHGYFPENEIDHINRQPDDNRITNLREATRLCNIRNRGMNKNNTSGVKGVYYNKKNDLWVPEIKVDYKKVYLGRFKSLEDAVKARWDAEVKYDFPNCNTSSSARQFLIDKDLIKE